MDNDLMLTDYISTSTAVDNKKDDTKLSDHIWFDDNGDPIETKNIILTKNYMLPCDERCNGVNNMNTITIASVGSGKTRGPVKSNLLNKGCSFVITDVKGDLVNEFGTYFETVQSNNMPAYKLKILDLKNLSISGKYNPFKYIKNDLDIEDFAKATVANIKSNYDPVWHQWAECLLKSIIYYMYETYENEDDWNIKTVLDIFKDFVKTDDYADLIMELSDNSKAKAYFKEVDCRNSEKTWACIVSELGNALQQFENIQDIMLSDDLDLESVGRERTALFIIVDDTRMSVFGFIISIIYTQIFQVLCREAAKFDDKKLPQHVRFIMDDFANYKIPNINDMISTARSRNISIQMMLQSESQLSANYGISIASNIIANCCYIYMAGNDYATISKIASRVNKTISEIQDMTDQCIIMFPEGKTIIDTKCAADIDHPFYNLLSKTVSKIYSYTIESDNIRDYIAFQNQDNDADKIVFANEIELIDYVAKTFDRNSEWLTRLLENDIHKRISRFDSGFEVKFYYNILLSHIIWDSRIKDKVYVERHVHLQEIFDVDRVMRVSKRVAWKLINMSVDFCIWGKKRDVPLMVFEIDGKEYHSAFKQLRNDRFKDLLFMHVNIDLIRIVEDDDNNNSEFNCKCLYKNNFYDFNDDHLCEAIVLYISNKLDKLDEEFAKKVEDKK